jgi:hypothetical protein
MITLQILGFCFLNAEDAYNFQRDKGLSYSLFQIKDHGKHIHWNNDIDYKKRFLPARLELV